MVCSVCKTRSAVGYCSTCRILLCERCSTTCAACHQRVCAQHAVRLPEGKILCPRCAEMRRQMQEQRHAAHVSSAPPAPSPVSTSFASLIEELPPVPTPVSEARAHAETVIEHEPRRKETPLRTQELSAEERARRAKSLDDPEEIKRLLRSAIQDEDEERNFRVLSASAPKATPIWLSGLFTGAMAFILVLPLIFGRGFEVMQPFYSYSIMLLGGGTILWTGYGLFQPSATRTERWRCVFGLTLGALAVILAYTLVTRTLPFR